MAVNGMNLSEMIEAAKTSGNEEIVFMLLDKIGQAEPQELAAQAADFDALLESWNNDFANSTEKAEICVKLADKGFPETPNFRSALCLSVRKLIPPYIAGNNVAKAIGAKDTAVSVREVAQRLHKLQNLRSTALVYQQETHQWGKIANIDKLTGTIGVSALESNSVSSVPIASAVITSLFFNLTPDFLNLLYPDKFARVPSEEYRKVLAKNALTEISDAKIRDIVFHLMVPACLNNETFEAWWTAQPVAAAQTGNKRFYADSRSILELYTLLPGTKHNPDQVVAPLTQADAEKLQKLFARTRKGIPTKEVNMLMECVALIAEADSDAELLKNMFAPLRGVVPFWPAVVDEKLSLAGLEYWGHISVKLLGGIIKATKLLYTQEELALIATRLPQRCISPIMSVISPDVVNETILKVKMLSSDLILWIWKNGSTVLPRLSEGIDMGCVSNALSVEGLPKEWTAAQRDLKKYTYEKKDFQKFLIENAQGDMPSILSAIKRCRGFIGSEQQTLIVRLAALSPDLTECLEMGEGRNMMGGNDDDSGVQVPMTSVASYKRRVAELENLISVLIPENAAAVALARSYGDLRENAEYDAAKERRRFLHKRRSELEKDIATTQSTDFKDVVVEGQVVLGSVVKLSSAGGDREYTILGAWDSDPEKNRIAYKARIGEILLNKKVGDTVDIPEAGSFTIKEILPLSEDLRKELAGE